MDWFQNLAEKAEGMLNKLDENAASVLNDPNQQLIDDDEGDKSDSDTMDTIPQEANVEPSNLVELYEENSISTTILGNKKACDIENKLISCMDLLTKCEEKLMVASKENDQLRECAINMQHSHSELILQNSYLQCQLDRANEIASISQVKIDQYKARARRVLQEKGLETPKDDSEKDELHSYIDRLKKDLQNQEDKYAELMEKFSKTSNLLSVLEENLMAQKGERQAAANLLNNETKIKLNLEEECLNSNKKLQTALDKLDMSQRNLKEKSKEVLKLQQLLNKPTPIANEDLENRLQTLTKTLMTKQNSLEAVTTERNALRFQVEKLEAEVKNVSRIIHTEVKIPVETENNEIKPQVPHFLKISPFDVGVTRRVKHAYSSLDAVSVRTGVFLRRYPLARVFVFYYMILLHIWVLIILCTGMPSSSVSTN